MIAVSDAFKAAVSGSHQVITKVEAVTGSTTTTLYPTDGSVTIDARRATVRSCSLTFADYDGTLTPTSATAMLAPFTSTLRIYRGVMYADGTDELVPLGVYQVTDTSVEADNTGVTISVQGEDYARIIQDKRWSAARKLTAGQRLDTTLATLVASLLGSTTRTVISPSAYSLPTTHIITLGKGLTQSPWEDLQMIALAAGYEIGFDAFGQFTGAPHPSLNTSAVEATYGHGGVLLGVRRGLTLDGIQNQVIITGEGTGVPNPIYSGQASDTAAGSPTNVTTLGARPVNLTSPLLTSNAQATAVAGLLLRKYVGQPVDFTMVADPSLEPRDFVQVQDPRISLDATVVIDSLTIPLAGGTMSVTGRSLTA